MFVHLLKSCYLYYSDYVLGMSEIKYLAGLGKSVEKDNILLHRVAINIFNAVSDVKWILIMACSYLWRHAQTRTLLLFILIFALCCFSVYNFWDHMSYTHLTPGASKLHSKSEHFIGGGRLVGLLPAGYSTRTTCPTASSKHKKTWSTLFFVHTSSARHLKQFLRVQGSGVAHRTSKSDSI